VIAAMLVWGIVFSITRYVSIASISAALALAIAIFLIPDNTPDAGWTRVVFVAMAILIIARHRSNIVALKNGTERKFERKKK